MKKITIFSSNNDPIYFTDDNDENLEKYIKEISKILESNDIVILHMTSGSVVLRPNIISAIIVNDVLLRKNKKSKPEPKKELKKESKKEKENEKENEKDPVGSITD